MISNVPVISSLSTVPVATSVAAPSVALADAAMASAAVAVAVSASSVEDRVPEISARKSAVVMTVPVGVAAEPVLRRMLVVVMPPAPVRSQAT